MPKGIKGFVKGQSFTEEHKAKLSLARIGVQAWNKDLHVKLNDALDKWREEGGTIWNKGKTYKSKHVWSLESRKKASESAKKRILEGRHNFGSKLRDKEKNRKDYTLTPEYKFWRKSVFERDDYTCQECRRRSGKGQPLNIQAHHIKPLKFHPELVYDIDNGLTLCEECHKKTDTFGRKIFKISSNN